MAEVKKCENCIYFRSKNGLASLFNDYYCANENNVETVGIFSKERVYKTVRSTSCCNLFTPKGNNGFRY